MSNYLGAALKKAAFFFCSRKEKSYPKG